MRRFLVLALAPALALAGCFSAAEEAPAPVEANTTAMSAENVTVDDGTMEMPMDLGHQPHIHDYWQGKERVTLMDEDVQSDPFTTLAFTFVNTIRGNPGVGGAFIGLPDGSIVFEGTGKLEFTASWTDATVTGMQLAYRSASADRFTPLAPLTQGMPFVVDVTPDMCDMPHEKDSRWQFLLMPAAGQSMAGKFHVKVDIVRMRDLAAFPGHPELFNGASTLTLFSGTAQSSQSSGPNQMIRFITSQGQQQQSGVQSEKVVPMETLSMTANVTINSATASVGKVSEVWFMYKAAGSSRGYQRAQLLSGDVETGVFQFGIPVSMKQTDSPYAKTSQWRFDLRVGTDPTGTGGSCGGCSDAQVDYELEVVAYDALQEGIEVAPEDD